MYINEMRNSNTPEDIPRILVFGLSDPLRFLAGLRLEDVFRLFDGLDALPEVLVSVLSVLDELCELCVEVMQPIITA